MIKFFANVVGAIIVLGVANVSAVADGNERETAEIKCSDLTPGYYEVSSIWPNTEDILVLRYYMDTHKDTGFHDVILVAVLPNLVAYVEKDCESHLW